MLRNTSAQVNKTMLQLGALMVGSLIQDPITNVSAANIGNCTNGLPAGVIGLPAVPQLGLPAVPFPAGFPSPPPALNEDVLRAFSTTAGVLAVFATILNLISTTLLAVGDIIAVIIVSTTLVTGPILFQLASVESYNSQVAAFPDMPNGYLTDFTNALGAIGSGLATPGNVFLGSGSGTGGSSSLQSALASLRGAAAQLRGLRTQLLPSSTGPRASVST
ncbi:hypothetical protein HaLaN_27163 [Haematococcus lacustris]|uniref:Uncharacterized protein n=1 Tax=Haematococcus lacustris TaxID=44745 RepID=A0A6A0A977_HAELA|nr:hypothetical protein HaLaN_27163 [Haematococcus lacustris]